MQFRGGKYDVIIIGTGPAGAKAAMAAARTGCSTLLLTLNSGTVASVMCSGSAEEPTRGHSLREIDVIHDFPEENFQKLTIESQKFVDNPYSAVYILHAQDHNPELIQQQNYYNFLPHFDEEPHSSESLSSEEYLPSSRKRREAYRPTIIDSHSEQDPFQEHEFIEKRELQSHTQRSQSELVEQKSTNPHNIRPFQTKAKSSKMRLGPFQTQRPDSPSKNNPIGRSNPEQRRAPFQTQKHEKTKLGPFQTKLPVKEESPTSQETRVYESRLEPFQPRPMEEKKDPIHSFTSSHLQSMEKRRIQKWPSEPESTSPLGLETVDKEHSILQERETKIRGKMLRRGSPSSINLSEKTSTKGTNKLKLIQHEETKSVVHEREMKQRRRLIGGLRHREHPTDNLSFFDPDSGEKKKKEMEATLSASQEETPIIAPFAQRKESTKRTVTSETASIKRVNPTPTDSTDLQESIPPRKNIQRQPVWEEGQSRKKKTATKKTASKLQRQDGVIPPQEAARQILKQSIQTKQTDGLKQDYIDFEDPYGSNSWEDLSNPFEDDNGANDLQTRKRKLALRGLNSLINNLG